MSWSDEWELVSVREFSNRIERVWKHKKTGQIHKEIEYIQSDNYWEDD